MSNACTIVLDISAWEQQESNKTKKSKQTEKNEHTTNESGCEIKKGPRNKKCRTMAGAHRIGMVDTLRSSGLIECVVV